jgi:hypothetical protein
LDVGVPPHPDDDVAVAVAVDVARRGNGVAEVAVGGYIKVAVLSRTSEPLAGYGLEDSVPMTSDTTKGAMSWQNAKNIKPSSTLKDHYRLKFEIKNAKLYSFWIE